jgi:hypothetical protein
MQYKITEILNFQSFYNSIRDTNLPLKFSYALTRLSQRLAPEIKFHYQRLQEIAEECGERGEADENGNAPLLRDEQGNIKINEELLKHCNQCLEDLYAFTYDVEPMNLTINDIPDTNISPKDLEAILPFLKEE